MKRFLRKTRVAIRRSSVTRVVIGLCIAVSGLIDFALIVGDPIRGDIAWQTFSDALIRITGLAGLALNAMLANWAYREHLLPQHIFDEARLDEKEMERLED